MTYYIAIYTVLLKPLTIRRNYYQGFDLTNSDKDLYFPKRARVPARLPK